jgi:hypothetical protein
MNVILRKSTKSNGKIIKVYEYIGIKLRGSIVKTYILHFGDIVSILTDNGEEITHDLLSEEFDHLLSTSGVVKSFFYHSQLVFKMENRNHKKYQINKLQFA